MKIRKQFTQEERELARYLRPIDDTFFRTMTKNNIPLVEHIVRVTLDRKDISILEVNTQDDIHIFEHSHSVMYMLRKTLTLACGMKAAFLYLNN